ncbi:MAG: DUF5700 domain-containing putative Zn-dependent protease [Thermoanaerobaculia bacterium]
MRKRRALPVLLAVSFAVSRPAFGAGLELVFDSSAAHATLDVLTGAIPATPEELARVAALPANQAQIRHAAGFRASYTTESFVEALGKAARGPVGEDTWGFGIVKERLAATKDLLARVDASPKSLSDAIAARLSSFIPGGETARVNVHFIVGGTSDGFAPEGSDFYIALHYFRGDEEGLRVLMSHELFHILRRPPKPAERDAAVVPRNVRAARQLVDHTMNEGVASWIGDPTRVTGGGPYVEWFAQKFKRNLDRLDQNVTLFDTILYRVWNDKDADGDALYVLGFSGGWDSPLYFVGYAMARYLAEKEGSGAVAAAVRAGPEAFFTRYRAAAKKHGSAPVTFSKSAGKILAALGVR